MLPAFLTVHRSELKEASCSVKASRSLHHSYKAVGDARSGLRGMLGHAAVVSDVYRHVFEVLCLSGRRFS